MSEREKDIVKKWNEETYEDVYAGQRRTSC